jgi:hypothetical protein
MPKSSASLAVNPTGALTSTSPDATSLPLTFKHHLERTGRLALDIGRLDLDPRLAGGQFARGLDMAALNLEKIVFIGQRAILDVQGEAAGEAALARDRRHRFALAAQKSLENLIGGATIYTDQPLRVGDFCRFGERVGTVEEVGLRSTRVRTLDRTLVSIPNADFSGLQLENFTVRDKIWFHPRIGLRYETSPDQIRYILVEIRKMLYSHPKVDPDPARIRFVNFGAYSLDLDVFAYVKTRDYGEYLEVAEDLNLRIMEIVAEAGSSFAFPSQTTYIENGAGLNEPRARQAESQVDRWRQSKELYLPGFPQTKIHELTNTLDYPPNGSPQA